MKPADPPRPTGTVQEMFSLDGMLLLARGLPGSPAHIEPIQILGGPLAVAVFSTMETLGRFREQFPELATDRIVKIDDTCEFFASIPSDVCIALDVRKTDDGKVRYFDVSPMR